MVKEKIKVIWRNEAVIQFQEILNYLEIESESALYIAGNAILDEIEGLSIHYNAHPLDRFKKDNDGNFRACIVFNYRISYFIENKTVYILRIRHTSREPLEY